MSRDRIGTSRGQEDSPPSRAMLSRLWGLRARTSYSDVRIVCPGPFSPRSILAAHRVVLAANSEYFREFFDFLDANLGCSGSGCGSNVVVTIPFASPELMTKVLEFMYTGNAEWQLDELETVLKLASYLKIDDLKDTITSSISAGKDGSMLGQEASQVDVEQESIPRPSITHEAETSVCEGVQNAEEPDKIVTAKLRTIVRRRCVERSEKGEQAVRKRARVEGKVVGRDCNKNPSSLPGETEVTRVDEEKKLRENEGAENEKARTTLTLENQENDQGDASFPTVPPTSSPLVLRASSSSTSEGRSQPAFNPFAAEFTSFLESQSPWFGNETSKLIQLEKHGGSSKQTQPSKSSKPLNRNPRGSKLIPGKTLSLSGRVKDHQQRKPSSKENMVLNSPKRRRSSPRIFEVYGNTSSSDSNSCAGSGSSVKSSPATSGGERGDIICDVSNAERL